MTKQDLNYWMMYHEVHHLKRQGCSLHKISEEMVINFRTVSKYLSMTEDEFLQHLEHQDQRYKKLCAFEEFVKGKLGLYPETRSAQMHEWLKKCIRIFLRFAKKRYLILCSTSARNTIFRSNLKAGSSFLSKSWSMVSRLRRTLENISCDLPAEGAKKFISLAWCWHAPGKKYAYFTTQPFTIQTAIIAHEKAFAYFQGMPEEVVYDQDKLFLHDENKGDLLLTKKFKAYTMQRGIGLHFCRKADPQSKGKIENVVRYVKQNSLYNRVFIDPDTLNDQAVDWLSRTANIMVHNRTRKVPFYEWHTEKGYLKSFTPIIINYNPYQQYCLRKDNTIAFKGNFYTLPEGTYKNKDSAVLLRTEEDQLYIYSLEKTLF